MKGAVDFLQKLKEEQEKCEEKVPLTDFERSLKPETEFVGTQAEVDYMAQFEEPPVEVIQEPWYKIETLPDPEKERHQQYAMRQIIEREKVFIKEAHV